MIGAAGIGAWLWNHRLREMPVLSGALPGGVAAGIAVLCLAAVLLFAMLAPRGLPEATLAVPAALLLVGLGIVSFADASEQVRELGPTVGFLAAVLTLAHLADHAGVFTWMGGRLAVLARGGSVRLLGWVFAAASITTAVLSLDATVVLLTPVVLATVMRLGVGVRPHVYACAHLANSASTVLPVSNLTNLLAFTATGMSFMAFAGVMFLPWLAVILVEYVVFRVFFRADLASGSAAVAGIGAVESSPTPAPRFALAVLGATLVGFGVSGFSGVGPVWVAVIAVVVLAVPALARRQVTVGALVREASPLFCLFVFALGVIVAGVTSHGLGRLLSSLLPSAPSFLGLLVLAVIAAVLANVVNNLPATLVILGALGPHAHPGLVLAMLIGVNVGPNLTYVGSLATLLWRRVLVRRGVATELGEFTRIGVLTVPLGLVAGVAALWVGLALSPH